MKKILLSCATCLLAVGLLAGCNDEVEDVNPDEPETTEPGDNGDTDTTYLLGVEVDGVLNYIDGGTAEGYAYEGTLTTEVSKAAAISCESSGSTYYLSFENGGVTNWVTIAQVVSESDGNTHTNLVYATEKSALYLHTTDAGAEYFGDEDGSHFLCYNSRYECFYASDIATYLASSPVAGLYTTDGKLVAGGKGETAAPAIEPVIGTVTAGEYFLGVTMSDGTYYFDGTLSDYYGSVSANGYEAAVVTVSEVTGGYTLSFTGEEATQYLYVYVDNGYVDLGVRTESFTWQYDTTYKTFVVEANDQWNFLGTYGSNQRLGMSAYGYLTGDISSSYTQYAVQLYEVITYVAPTGVTVSGETTVAVNERITLTATITGEDNVDPRLVWDWSSTDGGEVSVSGTGVVLGVAEGTVTVTATSVKDESISGSITITVTEASGEAPTAYKLGAVDTTEYVYRWFDGTKSSNLSTTAEWDKAVDVYITAIDDDTANTCTLSFYDSDGNLKYISATNSATSTSISDDPCTWYWNATYELFALGTSVGGNSNQDRGLAYYQSSKDIRAYATTTSNLDSYSWFNAFTVKPEDPEKPETPELTQVTSLTSGESYYFGAESSGVYHLITGSISSYELATTNDFDSAVQVTVTGSDSDGWKLTIGSQYIYVFTYTSSSGTSLEVGLSSDETVPSSGVNLFNWSSTNSTVYQTSVYSSDSYKYVYFEYYQNLIQPYGAASETSTFSNAAHFYQALED